VLEASQLDTSAEKSADDAKPTPAAVKAPTAESAPAPKVTSPPAQQVNITLGLIHLISIVSVTKFYY